MLSSLSSRIQSSLKEGDGDSLQAALALALQTPGYQVEALIWQGLAALREGRPDDAFLSLARARESQPERSEPGALLGRCLLQLDRHDLAMAFLDAELRRFPTDAALRKLYWEACKVTLSPGELIARIRAQLIDIHDPAELRQVLQILANDPSTQGLIGVIHHDPASSLLSGWAVNLANPGQPPRLRLEAGAARGEFPADAPSPLLTQAGFPASHGGILIRLPQPLAALRVSFANGGELIGSPLAALPAFSPPAPSTNNPSEQPVDILVPVFKGVAATLECLDSLLRHSSDNRTPHRIVVLDDASPEAELAQTLDRLAAQRRVQLVRHPANLGFIRNMNRGMALHPERDVVWLNADTRVHGDWLDRLRAVAYLADDIASVTPFSNNGELMSFPESRIAHPMPEAQRHAELDDAAREASLSAVELEMGCGFCFYIKRRALDAVGYLDEVELKRGYGEESDWCLRARAKGWRHMGATNVFVAHAGGHSFGPEKALRVAQNNAVLRRRYPDAERRFDAFVARDPLRPAREALRHRLAAHSAGAVTSQPPVHLTASPRLDSGEDIPLLSLPGRCWLIADRIDRPELGERWLWLARDFARRRQPFTLLLADTTPWEVQLLATGRVSHLPRLEGLSDMEILSLCGAALALSLDEHSRSEGPLQTAAHYQLPLFAPESAGLGPYGARDLDELRPHLSEILGLTP